MEAVKILCKCGNQSVYWYAPGYVGKSEEQSYFCEDCVPRGCSCNWEHMDEDWAEKPPTDGSKWKWVILEGKDGYVETKEGEMWTHLDEKGREYPCCEFWYEEKGCETPETITLYCSVTDNELDFIVKSNYRKFPEQLILYVLNEGDAIQIATDSKNSAYIAKFELTKREFDRHNINDIFMTEDFWEFNVSIIGKIEIIHEFKK